MCSSVRAGCWRLGLTKSRKCFLYRALTAFKVHNVDVLFREDVTVDEFIDVVMNNVRHTPDTARWPALSQAEAQRTD